MSEQLDLLRSTLALSGSNANFIEDIYEQFLQDPNSVSQNWRKHFEALFSDINTPDKEIPHSDIRQKFSRLARQSNYSTRIAGSGLSVNAAENRLLCCD